MFAYIDPAIRARLVAEQKLIRIDAQGRALDPNAVPDVSQGVVLNVLVTSDFERTKREAAESAARRKAGRTQSAWTSARLVCSLPLEPVAWGGLP